MSGKGDKSAAKKSLSDADIATFARRPGPISGGAGTDADSDAHAQAHTDSDQSKHTDKDS